MYSYSLWDGLSFFPLEFVVLSSYLYTSLRDFGRDEILVELRDLEWAETSLQIGLGGAVAVVAANCVDVAVAVAAAAAAAAVVVAVVVLDID